MTPYQELNIYANYVFIFILCLDNMSEKMFICSQIDTQTLITEEGEMLFQSKSGFV